MKIKVLRFLALVFAALTVGMRLAHVLELGPKMAWDADLYFSVQSTLYRFFAIVGPIVDVGAIISIIALVVILRGRTSFSLTAAALIALLASLAIWLIVVAPAHGHLATWIGSHTVPDDWMHWRNQWQFGQAGCFVFDLSGFMLLLLSVIRDTPGD
ncbi:MAG: hypothetical protein K8S54_15265 [Spirochaetia bacterium]|nr:hypothetical protein [Spirochaetia bacterium]